MNRRPQSFALFFGLGLLAATPALAQQVFPAAPREVLVKFRTVNPARVQEVERDEDIEDTRQIGGTGVLRLRSRSKDALTLIRRLAAQPDIEYAEPNYIVQAIATPNDPYYSNLWGMTKISAPSAWDVSKGSTGTVVGVVDTGVDYTHPDLTANIWSAPGAFTVTIGGTAITCPAGSHGFNAILRTCNPMDDNNHGTHVSGTIGALGNNGIGVAGVNWTASILGAKFLNSAGSGSTADAIDAIEFAIQAKLLSVANVRILSNSWGGGGFSQALLDEINRAYQNGIVFVAAAGNSGVDIDNSPSYPASYNAGNIIAVAATDSNDLLASFSNYGATSVDLGAPGVSILSTIIGGSYAYYSGTSMATPHVSGAAALVLSACALGTVDLLKSNLLNNVDPVASLAGKTVTGGRLNVNKAITACAGTPDFTLSASPASRTVIQGNSTTYAITVAPSVGFSGAVTLSASGLPAGAAASFSPNPIPSGSTSATMTVTTAGTTPTVSSTLTVTGVSGSLTHSTSVALVVNPPPDFSISASPPSQTVTAGASTSYTVTIGALNGFTGNVDLSFSGLPSGATASFSVNPVVGSGNSTLAISTTSATTAATYTITITGNSSPLAHSTTVTLVVNPPQPDFAISASPPSQTITAGGTTTYTVTIGALNNFTGSVSLTAGGLPAGATASYNPAAVANSGNSTLTISTGSTTPAGSYTITITGASGSLTHSINVTLVVNTPSPADFTLSASPTSRTVRQGSVARYSITVTPSGGFSDTVSFSVSNLPAGATASFSPTSVTTSGSTKLSVSTSSSTPVGSSGLTITGTGGGLIRTVSVDLAVK